MGSWPKAKERNIRDNDHSILGAGQQGSDGLNRTLTGIHFVSPVGVRLVPLKTHDFKGFGPDSNQILPDVNQILTGFHEIWLEWAASIHHLM